MSVLYPMKYFASISLFISKANSLDTDIFSIPTLLIAFLEKWIFFFSISSLSIFNNCSTISYTILRKKMFFIERERERERERAQIFFFWIFLSMCQWFGTKKFLLQWANLPNFSVPLRVLSFVQLVFSLL